MTNGAARQAAGPAGLTAPRLPPRVISRPRLLRVLDAAADLPLTLVVAGPGSGKTVLLSEWARRQRVPPAWLTLSPQHNRADRFWSLFERARSSGSASAGQQGTTAADVLDRLDARTDKLTVVLDDAHMLTDADIIDGLDHIIRAMHDRVRLILAARWDPLVPIYRYRMDAIMAELRAGELAMTQAEAKALLEAHGVRLPESRVSVLTARTEGWVAGLRLSALRMENSAEPDLFIDEFALDQGSIGEYLISEVLNQIPNRVRRLLIETSFLEELDASLVQFVTGNERAREDLAQLSRSNSFIVGLDSTYQRFRVHQLMREILAYLLSEEPEYRHRDRLVKASIWCAAHADPVAAVRWALAAGDVDAVATRLACGALASAYASPELRPELASIDFSAITDVLAQRPTTTSISARWAIRALTADVSEVKAALAEMPAREEWDASCTAQDLATREIARLMLAERIGAHGIVEETAAELSHTVQHAFPEVAGLSPMVTLATARARYNLGGTVPDTAVDALERAREDDAAGAEIEMLAFSATIDAFEVRALHAADALSRATALVTSRPDTARNPGLDVATAARAYVLGDPIELDHAVHRLRAAGARQLWADVAAATAVFSARSLVMSGRLPDAAALLKADAALAARGPDRYTVARDCELADIDVRLGRPQAAMRVLRGYAGTPLELHTAPATARAHLALGELADARNRCRAVVTADEHVSRFLVVAAMVSDAAVELVGGHEAAAVDGVERAIHLASGEVVQPFAAAADVFRPVLTHHPTVALAWPGGLAVSGNEAVPAAPHRSRELPDPLTERERSVLRFLCTSLSGKDIADELCVSIHTVRTHQAAIYRKLSARNRREAVRRARELEVI